MMWLLLFSENVLHFVWAEDGEIHMANNNVVVDMTTLFVRDIAKQEP